jgi:replication factor C small subunit
MKPESIPNAVLILADYSYKSGFMADKELNVVACMVELMGNISWT